MVTIARGLKGIRKFLNDNPSNWHLIVNGKYVEYLEMTFAEVCAYMENESSYKPSHIEFTGWFGNTLQFNVTKENTNGCTA